MKRFFSILLLAILLFNSFGYLLMISLMESTAENHLESRLDNNNYDPSQLISFKAAATYFSYYTNSKLFERVDGQIEIRGIQYKYVKRRLFNDSLELICIPNPTAMILSDAKNDFFKLVNDIQHKENRKGGPDISKHMSSDFLKVNHHEPMSNMYFTTSSWAHYFQDAPTSDFTLEIENPPESTRS